MIKTALFVAAAALATIATSAPVLADQVPVTYQDLDLTTLAGQDTLAKRLDRAAREACGYGSAVTGSRMPSKSATQCYAQAKTQARDALAAILKNNTELGG